MKPIIGMVTDIATEIAVDRDVVEVGTTKDTTPLMIFFLFKHLSSQLLIRINNKSLNSEIRFVIPFVLFL